jgi:uncharacterized protein
VDMIKEEKLPSDILEKLKSLPGKLNNDKDIIAFIAFGSAATGKLKPLSDIDLAVLLDDKMNKIQLFEKELDLRSAISQMLGTEEFDLVNLNLAPARFVHNILSEGKLVFCKHNLVLADFIEKNTREYLDFKYYREEFDRTFRELLTAKYNG